MSLEGRLLIAEDDPGQRELLADFLREQGAEVSEAVDGREALSLLRKESPDLVITDLRMPHLDGRALLGEIRKIDPEIRVIVVTAFGSVEGAVSCLKEGAADYLLKPLDLSAVEHAVRRAVEDRRLRQENRELRERLGRVESIEGIVTTGGAMSQALSQVARVARSEVSVLLQGESGTGKELVARAIHAASERSHRPFVPVNATALSESLLESELFGHERGAFTGATQRRIGRFESAGGGTLFLDEIGDLPARVQVKLLRVLQERSFERVGSNQAIPVDVRVISATHDDLLARTSEGRFRDDLYYRLAVVTIDLPPLRRRRSDVPLLVEHFLEKHGDPARNRSVSREVMDRLVRYHYPGNVRELENIIQRSLALAREDRIAVEDLPPALRANPAPAAGRLDETPESLPARVRALEREAIAEALQATGGHQTRAAALLGISERTLRYKLSKLGSGDGGARAADESSES